jgi:hypothetical protein
MTSRAIHVWLLIVSMMFSLVCWAHPAHADVTVKIGDYIRFGKLYNAPIMWRVIHLDALGDALLFSDRILALKAYDARGTFHKSAERRAKGSNNWQNANIRQWLNSSSPNTAGARIDWLQNDPNSANTQNRNNGYVNEKGFLADGNFSAVERTLIKPVTNRVLLAGADAAQKDGGTQVHMFNNKLANILTNADKAYYKNVSDRVFLLSVQQLKAYVYDRRSVLGSNYHIAKPTSTAVSNSTYKSPVFLNSNLPWYYWLNTPSASTMEDVRFVFSSGGVGSNVAALDNNGIRPALYLKVKATSFAQGGKGTSSQPYVVSTTGGSVPATDKQPPTVPTNLRVTGMNGNSLSVQWTAARDNVAVSRYEVYVNNQFIADTSGTTYTFKNLSSASPLSTKIRAVDRAGNKSGFSASLSSGQTIQQIGNRLFVNFKEVKFSAGTSIIQRNTQTLVPARPILQTLGLKVQWNENKNQLTATTTGYIIKFTIGNRTAVVNNLQKTLPTAPLQVKGTTLIPLSFVAAQFGYKLNVKIK